MLDRLLDYARAQSLGAEPGFEPKRVRWALDFASDGRFLGVLPLGDTSDKRNPGQQFSRCPAWPPARMVAGGLAHPFVETCLVIALLLKEGATEKELQDATTKHLSFVKLMTGASGSIHELSATVRALGNRGTLNQIRVALLAAQPRARPTDKATFRIEGSYPVDTDACHAWWKSHQAQESGPAGGGRKMLCLATAMPVVPLLQPKISGLADVGGMGMGTSLIGYDKDAFQSYGLSPSQNGAVSEEAAASYKAALDHLLDRHSRRLAGAKVAHWFTHSVPPEDDPLEWIETPQEAEQLAARQKANELLDSIRTGTRPNLQGNRYYALTISGAAGRAMVRDWMEGQFEDLVRNVTAWFDDLSIMRRDGSGLASPPKFMAVLGSTVRALDDLAAPSVTALWRSALTRGPIPGQFLAQALARARIDIIEDQNLNHARFGLIKAFHVRQGDSKVNPYLNEDHPSPAYHCGRLMAVYARLQYAALGDVGAGVVQRFYAAASATPALVLGRLARLSQFHLSKLDPGLARYFDSKIANINMRAHMGDRYPAALNLEEQSLFALGYYQQLAADRAPKAAADETTTPESEENNV